MTSYLPPSIDRFRALARSSPWRWTTLEFEWTHKSRSGPSHAWVRRPGAYRVELADGTVTSDVQRRPRETMLTSTRERQQQAGLWPQQVQPLLDGDGLVSDYPQDLHVDYDAPFYANYHWVAMLTPFELADGTDWVNDEAPVRLTALTEVHHHGRLAWEATAAPTESYEPRCDCCALLSGSLDNETQQWIPDVPSTIRLDVQTGVCVYVEHHRQPASIDLEARILAVDAVLDDDLFIIQRAH
ncbi:hypothetical protein [Rhodococcus wratislaviensis]|uniref:hypothetical protein n=1 Tax=Rhodococcus wratislaviensis TaxID=44752 RepID=UPI003655E76D